jgi:hypothetical protein
MEFLRGLAEDVKINLLEQLRVLWTHTSTAIEGNTLTLGETAFVQGRYAKYDTMQSDAPRIPRWSAPCAVASFPGRSFRIGANYRAGTRGLIRLAVRATQE